MVVYDSSMYNGLTAPPFELDENDIIENFWNFPRLRYFLKRNGDPTVFSIKFYIHQFVWQAMLEDSRSLWFELS